MVFFPNKYTSHTFKFLTSSSADRHQLSISITAFHVSSIPNRKATAIRPPSTIILHTSPIIQTNKPFHQPSGLLWIKKYKFFFTLIIHSFIYTSFNSIQFITFCPFYVSKVEIITKHSTRPFPRYIPDIEKETPNILFDQVINMFANCYNFCVLM